SKIEQICVQFEQSQSDAEIDLSDVHPMNLASVVKLYLRKLPEPLMTFTMYQDWLDFDTDADTAIVIKRLRELTSRLPEQNYDTLKFLMLHLKRVTWFDAENLMTSTNLAAVISPSLIWHRASHSGPSVPTGPAAAPAAHSAFITDAHQQTKVVQMLIQHAFEIFCVDHQSDWKAFFERYPEVEEPKNAGAECGVTTFTIDDPTLVGDEDDLEEEYEISDDEPEPTCSSSAISRQPPTPDLLRNTTGARNVESSSDDLELDGATSAATFNALVRRYTAKGPAVSNTPSALPPSPKTTATERPKLNKQRSFTTSILVSPQPDRRVILPQKQHSMETDEQQSWEQNGRRASRTLQSGEVTVDIKKDQYFLPSYSPVRRAAGKDRVALSSASLRNPVSNKESGYYSAKEASSAGGDDSPRTDSDRSTDDRYAGQRICLQSVGVVFTGNDVSYV
ncbi:RhoGAP domain-containing protein, partial [Aphelenchoides avenae]